MWGDLDEEQGSVCILHVSALHQMFVSIRCAPICIHLWLTVHLELVLYDFFCTCIYVAAQDVLHITGGLDIAHPVQPYVQTYLNAVEVSF